MTQIYEYKGKSYTRDQLYTLFEVSRSMAYSIMKQHRVPLTEIPNYEKKFRTKLKENYAPQQQIPIRIETFEDMIGEDKSMCSFFGCGERLSLQEKLFGSKCTIHQNIEIKTIRK